MKKTLKKLVVGAILSNLLISTSIYATVLHEIRE